jgi:hypothetical protein
MWHGGGWGVVLGLDRRRYSTYITGQNLNAEIGLRNPKLWSFRHLLLYSSTPHPSPHLDILRIRQCPPSLFIDWALIRVAYHTNTTWWIEADQIRYAACTNTTWWIEDGQIHYAACTNTMLWIEDDQICFAAWTNLIGTIFLGNLQYIKYN